MADDPPRFTSEQITEMLAAARRRPDLQSLDWGEEDAAFDKTAPAASDLRTIANLVESDPRTYDARRTRIRDRYIGIRFEGIAGSAEDLQDPERVIKASRLAFEEGAAETALELLELSIEQNPHNEALWLAEMELAFLLREERRFVDSARAFRAAHPASKAWNDVQRLGRAIAPEDALFGSKRGPRDHEHYGPWPDMPNWIQAPWDLTADVMAADLRRLMTQPGADTLWDEHDAP